MAGAAATTPDEQPPQGSDDTSSDRRLASAHETSQSPPAEVVQLPSSTDIQAGAVVEGATWRGVEPMVSDPISPVPIAGSEISFVDQLALNEQAQRHKLQLYAAGGIAVMTILMYAITLTARAVNALDSQSTVTIIQTLIGPMVVSGLIAIIAWLFGNSR